MNANLVIGAVCDGSFLSQDPGLQCVSLSFHAYGGNCGNCARRGGFITGLLSFRRLKTATRLPGKPARWVC